MNTELLAVVKDGTIVFIADRETCLNYLRKLSDHEYEQHDLRYVESIELGRLSSFVV